MTDTAGPFDPPNGTWSEAQWYRFAGTWVPSGCLGSPPGAVGSGDLPFSQSGLTVGVAAGRAWVRGGGFERTGAAVMQAVTANAHATFSRRDRLVLRRNLATHTLAPVVVLGTAASSPTPPALTLSESGSWDLPLFSWLAPPASGTTLTSVIDERGWIDPGGRGPVTVPSAAVRDAHFPSPVQGDVCNVAGTTQTHDGTAWRFILSGVASVTTDSSGIATFAHGGGQTPRSWVVGLSSCSTDAQTLVAKPLRYSEDATNLAVRYVRTDSGAYFLTQPSLGCTWIAYF